MTDQTPNALEQVADLDSQEKKILDLKDPGVVGLEDLKDAMKKQLDEKAKELKINKGSKAYRDALKKLEENFKQIEEIHNFAKMRAKAKTTIEIYKKGPLHFSEVVYVMASIDMKNLIEFRDRNFGRLIPTIMRDTMKTEINATLVNMEKSFNAYFDDYLQNVGKDLMARINKKQPGHVTLSEYSDVDNDIFDIELMLKDNFYGGAESKKAGWKKMAEERRSELKAFLETTKAKLDKDNQNIVDNVEKAQKTEKDEKKRTGRISAATEARGAVARERLYCQLDKEMALRSKQEAAFYRYTSTEMQQADAFYIRGLELAKANAFERASKEFRKADEQFRTMAQVAISKGVRRMSEDELLASSK